MTHKKYYYSPRIDGGVYKYSEREICASKHSHTGTRLRGRPARTRYYWAVLIRSEVYKVVVFLHFLSLHIPSTFCSSPPPILSTMEQAFETAVANHILPGVVLVATDRTGTFTYSKSIGSLSLDGSKPGPITTSTPMWIASCTKLITTIAALQCVERGLFSLDNPADVQRLTPEVSKFGVLTNTPSAEVQATYIQPKTQVTLRQMLTHTAGMAYDLFNVKMIGWRKSRGEQVAPGTTTLERYAGPLIYEPGTSWEYSVGIDMTGLMIERATGMDLHSYMQKEIWAKLGIKDMAFSCYLDRGFEGLKERMPVMTSREGEKVVSKPDGDGRKRMSECNGGGGIVTSPEEYLKVLRAVLVDDGTLLSKETVARMFEPQLGEESRIALNKFVDDDPAMNDMFCGVPAGTGRDWGLGGLLVMGDLDEGWTRKGTMKWGGLPNLIWFIDREAGLCGMYASQLLPPGDHLSVEMGKNFEKEVYRLYRESQGDEKGRL